MAPTKRSTTTSTAPYPAGETSKKVCAQAKKKPKEGRTDPTTWRQSNVPRYAKITKTGARRLYRLNDRDFQGLQFENYETGMSVPSSSKGSIQPVCAYLYKERQVERKAWEKHDGPEGFEKYLEKRRATFNKQQDKKPPISRSAFPTPDAYAPNADVAPTVIRILPSQPDPNYDPYTPNQELRKLKRQFKPWVWERCNETLGHPHEAYTRWSSSSDRFRALQTALHQLESYPQRPTTPLPPSPSVDHLRAVLSRAPLPPRYHDESENTPEGIEEESDLGDVFWRWTDGFMTEIFDALNRVIDEHGLGDDGWGNIRWEVYDKYSKIWGGITCSRNHGDDRWIDGAQEWLAGKYDEGDVRYKITRARCESGWVYNSKLPKVAG